MLAFAATVDEDDLREQLHLALDGKGAFGRFRSVVERHPDLQARWTEQKQKALVSFAETWLREEVGVEPIYELPRRRPPPAPQARREPEVTLVDLLLLGAPDGKTELVGGKVRRVLETKRPDEARRAFARLARQMCELYGIGWRKRFVEGKGAFELDRMRLSVSARGSSSRSASRRGLERVLRASLTGAT